MHQLALTDGGRRLLHAGGCGTLRQTELGGTDADGAGGNQNHFIPAVLQVGDTADQPLDTADVELSVGIGQG